MDRWRPRDWRDRDEHYNEDREDRYYRGGQYRGGDEYRTGGDQYGSYGGYDAYDRGMARGSDRGFAQDYDRDRGYFGRDRDNFNRERDERGYFDRGNYGMQRDERPLAGRSFSYRDERLERERMMRSDAGPRWERTVGHGFEFDRDDVRRDGWRGRGGSDREQRDREYGRDYWDDYPWSARRW